MVRSFCKPALHSSFILCTLFYFNRNYAIPTPNLNVPKARNLENTIKELKGRIENKSRLTNGDLQSLLTKLKAEKVDSTQALEILKCCSFARIDQNQINLVNTIWDELKKQNNQFQIQHYNCLLQFARDKANTKMAQKIFDEMAEVNIKPDA